MPSFHTYEPWHHAKHAKPAIKFLEHVASCKYIAMCPCSPDTFHLPRKLAMLPSYVLFCVSRQLRSKVDESRCSNKTTTYLRISYAENTLLFTRSLFAHSSTVKCSFLFRSSRVGNSGNDSFETPLHTNLEIENHERVTLFKCFPSNIFPDILLSSFDRFSYEILISYR